MKSNASDGVTARGTSDAAITKTDIADGSTAKEVVQWPDAGVVAELRKEVAALAARVSALEGGRGASGSSLPRREAGQGSESGASSEGDPPLILDGDSVRF